MHLNVTENGRNRITNTASDYGKSRPIAAVLLMP